MPDGPWTQYAAPSAGDGPWTQYQKTPAPAVPAPSSPQPGFWSGVGTGLKDKALGALQFGAAAETPDEAGAIGHPELQIDTQKAITQHLATREQQLQREGYGQGAASAGRTVGQIGGDIVLSAPIMLPGGGVITSLPAALLRGLAEGGIGGLVSGATQPVTKGEYGPEKFKQLAAGGIAGAAAGGVAGAVLGPIGRAIAGDDPEIIDQAIRGAYYKGVRPGASMTAPERGVYEGRMREAVDAIVETAGGRPTPRTPEEFSKAIGETKSAVYSRYTDMAKQAEAAGARVELEPAADRLRKLAGDNLQDPAAVNEAKRLLAMIPGRGMKITPPRAEEIMKFLNERASGFDTLGTKGAGAVFREAAGALRGSLVDAVHRAGFPEYGALRQTYGALTAIEDDVGRATTRALNQGGAQVGLSEIGAAGLAGAGEPVSAAAVEGGKFFARWLKSPNRAIRRLFDEAQQAQKPRPGAVRQMTGDALSRLPLSAGAAAGGLGVR